MSCNGIHKYVGELLIKAAKEGDAAKVQELLNIGINPNFRCGFRGTALIWASYLGHLDVVRILLKNKADVNLQSKSGFTALIEAAYQGNMDITRILLENKADANLQDDNGNGWTALIWASYLGHLEMVRILLKNNADVNLSCKRWESTALKVASNEGHSDILELLKKIHRNQIREGFKMVNKDGSIYVCDDIVNLIGEFTY